MTRKAGDAEGHQGDTPPDERGMNDRASLEMELPEQDPGRVVEVRNAPRQSYGEGGEGVQ